MKKSFWLFGKKKDVEKELDIIMRWLLAINDVIPVYKYPGLPENSQN